MKSGDEVYVYSGPYTGYYGTVQEVGQGVVRVSHKDGFNGFWIDEADLIQPEPEPVAEND